MIEKHHITINLLRWYDLHARELPWRKDKQFYHVWLSEIMLQQTRVEAVIPYYYRFLDKAPSISALAALDEEVLMKLWEGLGYYQRARNLQKAAKILAQLPFNQWPSTQTDLQTLPGIGPYTSGALASIVYNEKVSAVDGNVLRVMARIHGIKENIQDKSTQEEIKHLVEHILPNERVGDFNQALMELGATVCIPTKNPRCDICPLQGECRAFQDNMQSVIPQRIKKSIQEEENYWLVVLQYQNLYTIKKRDSIGVLKGLWGFIQLPKSANLEDYLQQYQIRVIKDLEPIYRKHVFTHKIWHLYMKKIQVTKKIDIEGVKWVTMQELIETYSLPTAFRKFIPDL